CVLLLQGRQLSNAEQEGCNQLVFNPTFEVTTAASFTGPRRHFLFRRHAQSARAFKFVGAYLRICNLKVGLRTVFGEFPFIPTDSTGVAIKDRSYSAKCGHGVPPPQNDCGLAAFAKLLLYWIRPNKYAKALSNSDFNRHVHRQRL